MIGSFKAQAARMTGAYLLATGLMICLLTVFMYHLFVSVLYANDLIEIIATAGKERHIALALAVFSLPLGALYFLSRRATSFPPLIFLAAYVLAAAGLCGIYALSVSPDYVSDFQRMWLAASSMADSAPLPVTGIMEQRALLVLYPIVELFGPDPRAITIANSLIFVTVGLFGYDVFRTGHSHRMAQAFALIWLCCFEPVMAIGIPTHDLWGLLFIIAALWAASRVYASLSFERATKNLILWTALLGILLAMVQLQREVGIVLLVAVIFTVVFLGLWKCRSVASFIILPVISVLLAYGLSNAVLAKVGALAPAQGQENMNTARLVGFGGSFSNGRFVYGMAMRKTFVDPLQPVAARELAHSIFLTDIAEQPSGRISNVVKRMALVAHPGSQHWFYIPGVPKPQLEMISIFVLISSLIVFGLGALAIIRLLRSSDRLVLPISATMILFSGGMLIVFCMISELQPRYAFFMWLTSAMLIANGFFSTDQHDRRESNGLS